MIVLVFLVLLAVSWGSEFILKLREGSELSGEEGLSVVKRFGNHLLVRLPGERTQVLRALSQRPEVEYVVPNLKLRAFALPDDPLYADQWGMKLVGAESAWDLRVSCEGVTVAVIDTGIDYTHEDLQSNMWTNAPECEGKQGVDDDGNGYVDDCLGWDFVSEDNDPIDDNGHGTMSAGIIGAVGNNGIGIAGVCWRASLMPLKILDSQGVGSAFDFLRAVYYAVDMGARVINTSLGTCPLGYTGCPLQSRNDPALIPLESAVKYALSKGVIVVSAAGNDGLDSDTYPVFPGAYSEAYPNVINVASVDGDGSLSWFSNYGVKSVDIGAPGGVNREGKGVISTFTSNSYEFGMGTSYASPFVAGAVAYILSSQPFLSPEEVKNAIRSGAVTTQELKTKVGSGGYLRISSVGGDLVSAGGGGGCSATGTSYGVFLVFLILARLLVPKLFK